MISIRKRGRRLAVGAIAAALVLGGALTAVGSDFSDVPDSSAFHADVAWLVANGITGGCGGGNFCPKNAVTREQMAAFLHRVDDKLIPKLFADFDSGTAGTSLAASGPVTVSSVDVVAPEDGVLYISGSVFINNNDAETHQFILRPDLDGSALGGHTFQALEFVGVDGSEEEHLTLAYSLSVGVVAGSYTVSQDLLPFDTATASWFYNKNNLSVLYVPENSGSVVTLPGASVQGNGGSETGD